MKVIVIDSPEGLRDYQSVIRYTGNKLYEEGVVRETFAEECIKREEVFPTGLATAIPVAIPHADVEFSYENAICVLRLNDPIPFKRMDAPEETLMVRLVINIAVHDPADQVEALRKIIRIVNDEELLKFCTDNDSKEVKECIEKIIGGK